MLQTLRSDLTLTSAVLLGWIRFTMYYYYCYYYYACSGSTGHDTMVEVVVVDVVIALVGLRVK